MEKAEQTSSRILGMKVKHLFNEEEVRRLTTAHTGQAVWSRYGSHPLLDNQPTHGYTHRSRDHKEV